jgi:acyl dehydratase
VSLKVGMKASRTARITAEHVRLYSQITGDYNPLHVDPEFASATRFKKRIVQGGLTSGLLNAIVAMNLPGPGTVFLETCWRFTNPVFIGDTIVGEVEVLEVHKTKPVSRIGVRIVRSDGETVVDGHAWCYTAAPSTFRHHARRDSARVVRHNRHRTLRASRSA